MQTYIHVYVYTVCGEKMLMYSCVQLCKMPSDFQNFFTADLAVTFWQSGSKHSSITQMCPYTTLWNVDVRESSNNL